MNNLIDKQALSLAQKVLLATDGTVTDLIALYSGEAIRVKKILQEIRNETAPADLRCEQPMRLLHRRILLAGARQNYLYADSLFVFERFSKVIQDQLLNSDRPIGLLWKEARLETYREVVAQNIERCGELGLHFALPAESELVSRTYLIYHGGLPLGSITEKWPVSFFRD